ADRPSLLVVPTSLIGNWQREAARFAPDLRLLILHGPDRRKHFERIPDHHLIVTTYPLLHRDREILFTRPFELAILDEAQAVKNPASAAAKLIREIDARQRLALTGTPIENNLEELWAIYDWVVPGLLGNRKTFRETFRHRIERSGDVGAGRRLAGRIRPFLLRRTKEQVATDLPPKTELDEIISLQGKQRDLYETVRVAMDARVREAIARDGLASTRITVLDALLKMRQACCDPRLVKLDEAAKVKESAKRARLLEMLEELLAEGRKVLVFSQFVEMLSLIEQDLKERRIDYALLTGETKKRAAVIDR
ncbi:MAG: helicase SNF2, partial [Geminicoccaceae bacterium]|nr:helicase SNF2 [Geminicoccaceae bacterium]